MAKKDYYEILGVPRDATKQDIKRAYRKLALKYHPDKSKETDAADLFKEISEAYAVLSDDEKRGHYDRFGHAGIDQTYSHEDIFRGVDFGDIFRDLGIGFDFGFGNIFNQFFGGSRRERRTHRTRGRNVRYDIEISLEDAYRGMKQDLRVPRMENCEECHGSGIKPGHSPVTCQKCGGRGQIHQVHSMGFGQFTQISPCQECGGLGQIIKNPCSVCGGQGLVKKRRDIRVNIPPGVDTGPNLRLAGEGEAGINGGPSGDLYVVVHVMPHSLFQRSGHDLFYTMCLSFPQAALGTEIELPTLDGHATLRVPGGTQNGDTFKLRGKGMPRLNGKGYGDMIASAHIVIPTKLTQREKELIQKLADETGTSIKKRFGIRK